MKRALVPLILVAAFIVIPAIAFSQQALTVATALETQVEAVYASAAPSVVNITSSILREGSSGQALPREGTGSGFIYDSLGHVVTNFHVVENADSVTVTLENGKNYKAKVIGKDPSNDLAVLKIDGGKLPSPLPIADSAGLKVGQFVVALGNPFGLDRTLTFGVISALGRVIQSPDGRFIGEAIQTDAPINPGNSGGPLLNLQGRVIGINSQIVSSSGSSSGIGFAVPSGIIQKVIPQLIAKGRYSHPWLGVRGVDLSAEWMSALQEAGMKVSGDSGLLVVDVMKGSPAAKAGIKSGDKAVRIGNLEIPIGGDIITAINGVTIKDFQDLIVYLEAKTKVGVSIAVTLLRGAKKLNIQLTLTQRPDQS